MARGRSAADLVTFKYAPCNRCGVETLVHRHGNRFLCPPCQEAS